MTTWYVIDTRSNEIINAIECSGPKPEINPKHWVDAEHLRLDANPPMAQLRRYGAVAALSLLGRTAVTRFVVAVIAGITAIVLTDLARWHIDDMWAPRSRR